jgi:hypothetical protein
LEGGIAQPGPEERVTVEGAFDPVPILWQGGSAALLVSLWVSITLALAHLGGWRSLAREYRATSGFGGRRFHFQSARLGGWVGYNGSLTAGSDVFGLHLSVWSIFRMGHPPLLIPWQEVSVSIEKHRWISVAVLTFARNPGITVRITRHLAEKLAGESRGRFALPP